VTSIDVLGYPIIVETGAIGRVAELIRERAPAHHYAIISDENVAPRYLATISDALARELGTGQASERIHPVVIPSGEEHKTREQWATITDTLLALGCGRDTTVIALGGGVIGDLAGFVAATYMRGVAVVQVPTTLLAMVDASVGGKTAVDTRAGKNTVGAFHPPALVVIDPSTLATLPQRELRAGLAEVIKHGVIADRGEIESVNRIVPELVAARAPSRELESLIERSVRIKAGIVASDEREHGRRKVLNFGHTVGHGVEAASGYMLLHGEAVAIGMVAEARLAERAGVAESGTAAAVEHAVMVTGLPTRIPATLLPDRVLALMQSDKKRRRGTLEYALPKRLGEMAGESSAWAIPVADPIALEILRSLY
jgi:3-dehydroquinate synthase